jgi:hypothetical protein
MMAAWLGVELCVSECKRETAGREHVNRLNAGEIHVGNPLMRDVPP